MTAMRRFRFLAVLLLLIPVAACAEGPDTSLHGDRIEGLTPLTTTIVPPPTTAPCMPIPHGTDTPNLSGTAAP